MEGFKISFGCFFQMKKFGLSCLKGEIISFDGKLSIQLVSTFYVNMLSILLFITWLLGLLKHYNL